MSQPGTIYLGDGLYARPDPAVPGQVEVWKSDGINESEPLYFTAETFQALGALGGWLKRGA